MTILEDTTLINPIYFINSRLAVDEMELNEWGFRPPSCTYRLSYARSTACGW